MTTGRWWVGSGVRAVGLVTALVVGVTVASGCDSGDGKTASEDSKERRAAIATVTRLRPQDPRGFDPDAWSRAQDVASVIPRNGRVVPLQESWVAHGDEATIDVVLRVPGQPPQKHWLFMRKVDGAWLVYGSLPLEEPR